jgi:hypothetical protein
MTEQAHPGLPRWVKVSAIVLAIVVLATIAALLIGGGGEHGPGRHQSGSSLSDR